QKIEPDPIFLRDKMRSIRALALWALLALAGCETPLPQPSSPPPLPRETPPPRPAPPAEAGVLRQASWNDLPEWRAEDPGQAWEAFQASCRALGKQAAWRDICAAATVISNPDRESARRFFEANFTPFQLLRADGGDEGLITGYYEPLLRGSRRASARYRYPLYGVPDDLLEVDLAEAYPELKGLQLRGRLEGRRVVPYYDRAQIGQGRAPLAGRQIAWVDDAVELFFLQVQGSGRITLDSGETLRIGYADNNGHPYRSIGRHLVERGELPLEKASMQGIQAWARANPEKLTELLNHNARYVFFRELPAGLPGPIGSLGVPLTSRRSLAVDPASVPLGAPVYIATTWPLSSRPLNRLMLAQDTGSAIRGAVRADFFWGHGEEAAREAGRMKQPLTMWVLLPNSFQNQDSGNR
ncbi:MAG: murein transglycosylase A, partial [Burkholderiales bacterium]